MTKVKSKIDFHFVLNGLKKHYPDAHCALNFKNPFQLLIATILSAQCTDERVNVVTKELFKKLRKPSDINQINIVQLEEIIRSTGFYKNKAKNIHKCCQILEKKYHNEVPRSMDELVELPGVGRKTANVVLGNAYGISSGVVVDTHVTRLAQRWGWVKTQDAVKIEEVLNRLCPEEDWIMLSHYMISHGRAICKARGLNCETCFLSKDCPRRGIPLS